MIVVILESIIDDVAFSNPFSTALLIDTPFLSSSLILSKISTLASTAIPMVNRTPAIPGKVNVTPISPNKNNINAINNVSAKQAIAPGTL